MEERQIVLDFTGCKYITEVHWRIRDTFLFPTFMEKIWMHSGTWGVII